MREVPPSGPSRALSLLVVCCFILPCLALVPVTSGAPLKQHSLQHAGAISKTPAAASRASAAAAATTAAAGRSSPRQLVKMTAAKSTEAMYADLAKIPVIAGGFLVGKSGEDGKPTAVMLRRSQKDLVNDEPFPTELRDVAAMVPSPSGRYLAVVRVRTKDGKKEQSIEVWDGGSLLATVSGNGEMHGAVYNGDVFSSLEWDQDETRLMYVAECKAPETSSFWQAKPAASTSWEGARWGGPSYEEKKGRGEEFKYKGDWGELCTGKSLSRLFVLHVPTGDIKQVRAPADGWAAGQGVFTPEGGVIFTAFSTEPVRLGVRFYNTRKSCLCYSPAPTFDTGFPPATQGAKASSTQRGPDQATAMVITPEADWSARSPRLSPDGTKLAYVVSADSAAHMSCSRLCLADWPASPPTGVLASSTIVDVVGQPESDDAFPGLFLASEQLPRRVWLGDSRHIVLHSDWRMQRELVVVDTAGQKGSNVRRIDTGDAVKKGSWVLLDVEGGNILASRSSPSHAPEAFLLDVNGGVKAALTSSLPKQGGSKGVDDIEWSVARVAPKTGDASGTFDSLLIQSKTVKESCMAEGKKMPLVVYPHGGPHSNQGVEFYAGPTLLCLEGYAVLFVNYRGSTGYGQTPLDSLCGRVGRQDVDDLIAATDACLASASHLDSDAILACGGSHGGFLSLHLVGQFPNRFKAAAVRNPVTNIASMFGTTDIPDWCFTEIGVDPQYAQPTREQYSKALEASPVHHVSKVTSPVLLLVGGADRRVPPAQSKEYFHAMKAGGRDVDMRWYADHTHGLTETPRGEGDGLVHIVKFFDKALKEN